MGFHAKNSGAYHAYYKVLPLDLGDFREVSGAGAVAATAAGAGVLSSDTTPVFGALATTEAWAIIWAAANSDIIQVSKALPEDFDGSEDALLDLEVETDNTGGGSIEAASFTALTSWNNGAQVSDSVVDSIPATTVHQITARISSLDMPNTPRFMNLQLVPGTHANDPIHLVSARLRYLPKLTS